MVCKKPSGDPNAISRAADAITSYANGIDQIFYPIDQADNVATARQATVDLSAFWGGEAAVSASGTLSQYRDQLNGYTDELRTYASQLQEYATELRKAQSCDIRQILIWIFLVVFTVAELIIGFFFGGIIEGALTEFFGPLVTLMSDAAAIVGEAFMIVGDVIEGSALFGRIITEIAEAGVSAFDFADVGATLSAGLSEDLGLSGLLGVGEVAGDFGEVGGAASGISVGGIVTGSDILTNLAESGIDVSTISARVVEGAGEIIDQLGSKLLSFMSDLPKLAWEQSTMYVYKSIYNLAEWYLQEFIIRGIESTDPDSGGFAALWNGADEQAEALSIFAGMAAGSLGYALSDAFLDALDEVMIAGGLDISGLLNSASRSLKATLDKAPESDIDHLLASVDSRFDDPAYWKSAFADLSGADASVGHLDLSAVELAPTEIKAAVGSLDGALEKADPAVFKAKDETLTSVVKEMFDDTIENTWDYTAILALYPSLRGEDFDFKELGWYVTYGIIESLLHAPVKHFAGAITEGYVGKLFPKDADSLKDAGHPVLSEAAKNIGNLMISGALSELRKITLDPLVDIGSFSDYLKSKESLDDSTDLTPPASVPAL